MMIGWQSIIVCESNERQYVAISKKRKLWLAAAKAKSLEISWRGGASLSSAGVALYGSENIGAGALCGARGANVEMKRS